MLTALLAVALLADPALAFRLNDPSLDEVSGMVVSSRDPGVVFVHEDSGSAAGFTAVDLRGRTLTAFRLPGVDARDWEDVAQGPDERGRPSLFFADIGDNSGIRTSVVVRRVPEPRVDPDRRGLRRALPTPTSIRLSFPDGRGRDAETLLVHPRTGRLWVVTKPLLGQSEVYAAPARLVLGDKGRNVLRRVGAVDARLVTGGDIRPDGGAVALRNYTDLYEWPVRGDDVGEALTGPPVRSRLPEQPQGEAVTYERDGDSLLTTSEGQRAAVWRVPSALPAGAAATRSESPRRPGGAPPAAAEREQRWSRPVVLGAGAVAVLLAMLLAWRRGR